MKLPPEPCTGVPAVCAAWNAATCIGLRPATVLQRDREIAKDLTPSFGSQPLSTITRLDMTTVLKDVEARAPEVARNLRNYLWGIFEFAIDSGLIENNPVPPVRVMRKRSQANHPSLSTDLLAVFLRKLDAIETIHEQTRIAMRLVVLTACRKAEVIGARWSEFDLKRAEWEIPSNRMKAGRAHWIPLSRQAMRLLHQLRKIVPDEAEHLFPNRVDPTRAMANRSLNALMERLGFSGEGTPHGMRAAFSTHFNAAGSSVDVIEHCLAHVPVNRVRAAYNRHAYREERRSMLQAWADHLDRESTRPYASAVGRRLRETPTRDKGRAEATPKAQPVTATLQQHN